VPVHQLRTTEQYLSVLDGHPTVFAAGEGFAYNNGAYVVLALIAERASGLGYHELVRVLVCEPGGLVDTEVLSSDELPGRAARGYLWADGLRTSVLHLPVVGNGDGAWLEGYDAGVSFTSRHEPSASLTTTVISNWSRGAWPVVRLLRERLHA
jgi:CubicO group peptidase (beta-lactamase class C family)